MLCTRLAVDLLLYLKVDFEAIFAFKYECARRDIERCGHDLYAQYGGFEEVFTRYYRRVADEYILPVEAWSDVVLEKHDCPVRLVALTSGTMASASSAFSVWYSCERCARRQRSPPTIEMFSAVAKLRFSADESAL